MTKKKPEGRTGSSKFGLYVYKISNYYIVTWEKCPTLVQSTQKSHLLTGSVRRGYLYLLISLYHAVEAVVPSSSSVIPVALVL